MNGFWIVKVQYAKLSLKLNGLTYLGHTIRFLKKIMTTVSASIDHLHYFVFILTWIDLRVKSSLPQKEIKKIDAREILRNSKSTYEAESA